MNGRDVAESLHHYLLTTTMKIIFAIVLLFTLTAEGQILIYKMTARRLATGSGFTTKYSEPGYVVVDTGNGAAAEFRLDVKGKEYSFRSKTVAVEIVHGGMGKDYMVFAEILLGTNNGGPYRFSSTAKGSSILLDIGIGDKRPIARTMQFVDRDVFRFGFEPFIDESAGTLVLDLVGTQSANSGGQTLDAVVTKIRTDLADKGYRDNHP